MEQYVRQLIEDLNAAAKNPMKSFWIEPPPHLLDDPETAELALVPFMPIEDWTKIKREEFPEMIDLNAEQCRRVNKAIFKVYESLNLKLVDLPAGIPPEILYEILTSNWDYPVQYLPSSGMDVEFCTGDELTCPYGEYCDCGEEWEEDENEIPERFEKVVPQIAEAIDAGLIFYLNPETMETEEIPQMFENDPEELRALTGMGPEDEDFQYENWEEFYKFEPLESYESFQIMESFTDSLKEDALKEILSNALSHRRPFANFRDIINNSGKRQSWFDFKKDWLEKHVRKLIWDEINKFDFQEELNGLYNDDGTKINPDSVPMPPLCVICKHHISGDAEENMLCLLNRNDQRDDTRFKCGMYEKI
jgi:hypothetical protein